MKRPPSRAPVRTDMTVDVFSECSAHRMAVLAFDPHRPGVAAANTGPLAASAVQWREPLGGARGGDVVVLGIHHGVAACLARRSGRHCGVVYS